MEGIITVKRGQVVIIIRLVFVLLEKVSCFVRDIEKVKCLAADFCARIVPFR